MKKISVVAALFTDRDRFLVTQRKLGGSFGGFWEFPGGKVETGESDEVALAREIEEELGVRCDVGTLFSALTHDYPDFQLDFRVYRCRWLDGEWRPLGVADLRWITIDQIDGLLFPPADKPILAALKAVDDVRESSTIDGSPRLPRATVNS